jgi:hypothetical protein
MKISIACAVLLVGIAACAVETESQPAQDSTRAQSERLVGLDSDGASAEDATIGDAAASTVPVAGPDELLLPESAASCRRAGGVCTNFHLCFGSGGHSITISCPAAQNVCCVQP